MLVVKIPRIVEEFRPGGAALDAGGFTAGVFKAKLALLRRALFRYRKRTVWAYEYAAVAAHASFLVDANPAVDDVQRRGYAALHADGVLAVAAGYREMYLILAVHAYAREDFLSLERLYHVALAGVGERAVIFTEMAA